MSIALLAFLILMLIGHILFHIIFNRRKGDLNFAQNENKEDKMQPSRLWFSKQNIKEYSLQIRRLTLKGYLLSQSSNKLVIILHGYRGRYYSSTSQAQIFYEAGYDVFMPNNRAHDTSSGRTFTMGPKEKNDLIIWINYLLTINPDYQIVLLGVSMGGHIVMSTVGDEKCSKNVKCFIEDCGYHSLYDELKLRLKEISNLKHVAFFMFAINLYCHIFHHFSINHNVKKSLENTTIPGLFIHGEADTLVPFDNLAKNVNSMSIKENAFVKTFPATGHNQSIKHYDEYKECVLDFVNRYIK